nr:TraX family protein [Bathymodiolus platifrons methanotrophic gill symbiont]
MKRMVIFGGLATPAFVFLGGGVALILTEDKASWKVLNIMFTLALLVWCLYSLKRAENKKVWLWVGWGSFWFLGAFVEFWWPALGVGVSIWWYYKNVSNTKTITTLFFSLFFLLAVNQGNAYFFIVIPLIYLASKL